MIGLVKRIFGIAAILFVLSLLLYGSVKATVQNSSAPYIFERVEDIPERPAALVLGAQVYPGREPSRALALRLATAVELYEKEKVKKLLMSGDGRSRYYDEVGIMAEYAEDQGVPASAIIIDSAGLRTYESCSRVKNEFLFSQVVIVTQKGHLMRAVYTCRALGIDAIGVTAPDFAPDIRTKGYWKNWLREQGALMLAWLDVTVIHPK